MLNKYSDTGGMLDEPDILSCPLNRFNCRDAQINESSMREHYISEQHQKSLVKCTHQIAESMNGDFTEADADIEEGQDFVSDQYNKLSEITNDIETREEELLQLDTETLQHNHRTRTYPQQLNDIQTESSLQKGHINAMSINQNVSRQDLSTLKQEIDNQSSIIKQEPDGTMVWKITNVNEKIADAQSERQTSVYSPAFFTSSTGYKVCIRLYLNGDGSARGSYISIFLVILRGPYDILLAWPFSYRVSFCLYDQRTMLETNGATQPKHIIESFRPDTNSVSFQKPRSAMNIASGIPRFFTLSEFNRPANENPYIVNDTIYIKILIDFIGYRRSLLPFIFNINIAFPVHIQQRLISEEIKRREEENIN